ncbi:MAG: pyridoxamine 5'-phosphate oxidase family protein [Pseudolysinimonas sp.]|uniref:pyridoxamine 5'-phosphate oxidase family protein n=1 Tax=Pseudolysinimonas sp. TaxID=2680009 RepID=UPI003C792745
MTTDSPEASRADLDLVHAVTRALVESPDLDTSGVRVSAHSGRVQLTGRVSTHSQRLAAATIASAISGVGDVDNQVAVGDLDLDAAHATDDELSPAVAGAIADSTVRVSDLRVEVRQRVVTLHGRLGSERERDAVRQAIEQVPGVHFVDNRLDLDPAGADVEELDPAACFELLGAGGMGRLGIQEAGGVDIFPVNYVVHDSRVYFRSGPGVKLIRLTQAPDVAFEADGHDDDWTWSVVVKGDAQRLDDDAEIIASGIQATDTAHPGDKLTYVRIQPRQITGRRFRHRG